MLLCCITFSSSRENQRSAQEVARRISGAVAGEVRARQVKIWLPTTSNLWCRCKSIHTKYPSQTLISRITLFAICLSFSSPPLHLAILFAFSFPRTFLPLCRNQKGLGVLSRVLVLWTILLFYLNS